MHHYRLFGLLLVAVALIGLGGLRLVEHRRAAAIPAAVAGKPCCAPAPAVAASASRPPAVPTGSGRPCLVELGSDKCRDCRRMAEVLTAITPKLKGKVDIVGINTDTHPAQAQRWRLRLIPTQVLVDAKGDELWRHEGYVSAGELLAEVNAQAGAAR